MGFFRDLNNYLGSSLYLKKKWVKKYHKLYGDAISKGYDSIDAHIEGLARILVAQSIISKYNVNRSKLIAELFPFGIEKSDERISLFFEYILYLQEKDDVKIDLLKNYIDSIVRESLETPHSKEYKKIITEAIRCDIGWTRLMFTETIKLVQEESISSNSDIKLTKELIFNIKSIEDKNLRFQLNSELQNLKLKADIFKHASVDFKTKIIKEFMDNTENDDAIRQISFEVYDEIYKRRKKGEL